MVNANRAYKKAATKIRARNLAKMIFVCKPSVLGASYKERYGKRSTFMDRLDRKDELGEFCAKKCIDAVNNQDSRWWVENAESPSKTLLEQNLAEIHEEEMKL